MNILGILGHIACHSFLLLCVVAVAQAAPVATNSLVPAQDFISDFDARLLLAELYARTPTHLPQAEKEYRALLQQRPNSSTLRFALADVLMRNQDFTEAAALYTTLAKTNFQPVKVQTGLADALFYGGNLDAALPHYAKAYALAPNNPTVLVRYAKALAWAGQEATALPLLKQIQSQGWGDKESEFLLAQAYFTTGRLRTARTAAQSILAQYPKDIDAIMLLGDIETRLGHGVASREWYIQALALATPSQRPDILVRQANRSNLWGDFNQAEATLRGVLSQHNSLPVRLELARVLANAQRYDEAEAIYRDALIEHDAEPEILLALADIRLRAHDPEGVLYALELLDASDRRARSALTLESAALLEAGRNTDAVSVASALAHHPDATADDHVIYGRTLLRTGHDKEAREVFSQAAKTDPHSIAAAYYDRGGSSDLAHSVIAEETNPERLKTWGDMFARDGQYALAINLYDAALTRDDQYIPAAMARIETLGSAEQYEEALRSADSLLKTFPDASKLLLTKARLFSWAKEYDASLEVYRTMRRINRRDPVPVLESARVAMWGKRPKQATEYYDTLIDWPPDAGAVAVVEQYTAKTSDSPGLPPQDTECIYQAGLDVLARTQFPPSQRIALERAVIALRPSVRIQTLATLEKQAKRLAYNDRQMLARKTFTKLIAMEPGNQEALFDAAQLDCAMGLGTEERCGYQRLLRIDPLHDRAKRALHRLDVRGNPQLNARYSFWDEDGKSGRLANISRSRFDLELVVPFNDTRFWAKAGQHVFIESPKTPDSSNANAGSVSIPAQDELYGFYLAAQRNNRSRTGPYFAQGQSIEVGGVFNPYIRARAAVLYKLYEDSALGSYFLPEADITFNAYDIAKLTVGYALTEEIFNDYSLFQSITAQTFTARLTLQPIKQISLDLAGTGKIYSDDNQGLHLRADLGLLLLPHPYTLKLIFTGEHRDTAKESLFRYQDDALVNIIHPYWTPRNYFAGTTTLEWRHDLAKDFFCGARRHFYDIRVGVGTDTDDNDAFRVEAEYVYDINDHWSTQVSGLIHRSREWDALGLWLGLGYRF
ncbi:tetratricopeptide repeat protein [Desulfovibrio inopinatus]|uniref:tetratricopeptide repeat protein n=1 Tax=Desulfovibrio inopinatus TaxID=102109 RepID=UPI00040BB150|nr:tetratricopeptide repeat protein [Desulfovibrio inopinatus]